MREQTVERAHARDCALGSIETRRCRLLGLWPEHCELFVDYCGLTYAVMADVSATYPEDHIFGDVGGVIGHPFEVPRDDQGVKCLASRGRVALHYLSQRFEGIAINGIDDVVALEHLLGKICIFFDESL